LPKKTKSYKKEAIFIFQGSRSFVFAVQLNKSIVMVIFIEKSKIMSNHNIHICHQMVAIYQIQN